MENILSSSNLVGGSVLDLSYLTIKKANIIINTTYNLNIKRHTTFYYLETISNGEYSYKIKSQRELQQDFVAL